MRNSALRLLVGLAGMLVSGTAPAAPVTLAQNIGGYRIDLQAGPADHNLAISVLDGKTGQPVTGADVGLYLQALNGNGEPGPLTSIPVVRTRSIGAGAAHPYESNVRLNPGRYRINATVNGTDLIFFTTDTAKPAPGAAATMAAKSADAASAQATKGKPATVTKPISAWRRDYIAKHHHQPPVPAL